MHLVRPDLDLERLAVERDDRGVERLIEVVLGDGDVVVELAGDRAPDAVDDAEGGVAVAHLVDEQADRVHVVDLAELRALALHLLPDAVDVLGPALDVDRDAGRLEPRGELGDRPLDVRLTTLAPGVEELGQLAEPLGLEGLEGEVLELPLDLPDPEPLRQRRVDLHRLVGDALLLLRRQPVQRPHVVEPIGELDEDDPDVLGHREQHLADVLGLLLLVAVGREPAELGDPVDEVGDLGPEALLEVGQAVVGVLRDIVEECRLDRDRIDPEIGEDLGGGDRVGDVRFAGRATLALMGGDGEVVGPLDGGKVGRRVVLGDRRLERGAQGGEVRVPIADGGRATRTAAWRGRSRRGLGRRRRPGSSGGLRGRRRTRGGGRRDRTLLGRDLGGGRCLGRGRGGGHVRRRAAGRCGGHGPQG